MESGAYWWCGNYWNTDRRAKVIAIQRTVEIRVCSTIDSRMAVSPSRPMRPTQGINGCRRVYEKIFFGLPLWLMPRYHHLLATTSHSLDSLYCFASFFFLGRKKAYQSPGWRCTFGRLCHSHGVVGNKVLALFCRPSGGEQRPSKVFARSRFLLCALVQPLRAFFSLPNKAYGSSEKR